MKRHAFCLACCLGALAAPLPAANQEFLLLADEAALTGGAVVALGSDLGAGWYNPAGLAGLDRDSVSLSASVYGLRLFELQGYLRADLADGRRSKDVSNSELVSVPVTVFIGKVLRPGLYLSFGILTPEDAKFRQSEHFKVKGKDPKNFTDAPFAVPYAVPYEYDQSVETGHADQVYDVGPSLGWRAGERLRLGLGLWAHYRKTSRDDRVWCHQEWEMIDGSLNPWGSTDDLYPELTLRDERSTVTQLVSGRMNLGLQADLGESWALGAVFFSPGWIWSYESKSIYLYDYSQWDVWDDDGIEFEHEIAEVKDPGTGHEGPWRATLALARRLERGSLTVEAEASDYFHDRGVGALWNLRAGWRRVLTERWELGLGIFTDFRRQVRPSGFGDRAVNYVGGNLGLQYRTPYALSGRPEKPLQVTTTVGLRWLEGRGEAGGLAVDPLAPYYLELSSFEVPVRARELAAYIGSGLQF